MREPFLLFCHCCAFGRSSASSATCSLVSPSRPSNSATRTAAAFSPGAIPRLFPSFSATAAPSPKLRQLRHLLLSQPFQTLQLRNTDGSSLSHPVPFHVSFLLFRHCCAFGRSSANSATCSSVSGPRATNASNTATRSAAAILTLRYFCGRFILFLLLLRHLRSKLPQLRLLLHRQPPPPCQHLQHRNPIGSNLSRQGPRSVPLLLLFLPLLRLWLKLRQLRLLLHRQPPPPRQHLQLRNPGDSSLPARNRAASRSFCFCHWCAFGRSSANSASCSTVSRPRPANASNTATRSAATFPARYRPASLSLFFCFRRAFGRSSASSASCASVSGPRSANASNSTTRAATAFLARYRSTSLSFCFRFRSALESCCAA